MVGFFFSGVMDDGLDWELGGLIVAVCVFLGLLWVFSFFFLVIVNMDGTFGDQGRLGGMISSCCCFLGK